MDVVLRLDRVTKRFGANVAVDDVSASFASGAVHGLIGPNGSGKTTVINLVSGFYAVDHGSISIDGRPVHRLRPHEVAARGVVRTFQMPKSFATMSVRDNLIVAAAADHRHETLRDIRERADEAIDLAGLTHMADTPAGSLSGGQTMLLQLARTFMSTPVRVLLLDEPFAGVAAAIKERMVTALTSLRERHACAVLLVSHEMETVRRLCDQVTVMNAGRVVAQGTLEQVARDERVIEAYLGRPA
jgi:ABC-type branched-subunit amino acid transport system ATPase component